MMDSISRTDNFIASLGVEAYRVGGSVRDEVLGRRPKDADYMVRGVSLQRLGKLLREAGEGRIVRPLKLRDGVQAGWRILDVEVVLPRTETSTGPGHRDFAITLDPDLSLEDDALRRDFTFNALYLDIAQSLYSADIPGWAGERSTYVLDPLGTGIDDLRHKTIRTTHPDSFRDDPLRILRALRFVSTLGYDLADSTRIEMIGHAHAVNGLTASGHVSGTVYEEMSKILMGRDAAKALRLARDTGVLDYLFPELQPMLGFDQESKWHDLTVDEHTFAAIDVAAQVDAPLAVRWSLLFHDSGKPWSAWRGEDGRVHYYSKRIKASQFVLQNEDRVADADGDYWSRDHADVGEEVWRMAAERINVPAKIREHVAKLIANHMLSLDKPKRNTVRKWRVKFGDDTLADLILHRACDCSGKNDRGVTWQRNMDALAKIRALQEQAIADKVPSNPQELDISGHDLMALGFQGGFIGDAQKKLLHEVITGQVENTNDALIARAGRWG